MRKVEAGFMNLQVSEQQQVQVERTGAIVDGERSIAAECQFDAEQGIQ
jgi:hypothetical protein